LEQALQAWSREASPETAPAAEPTVLAEQGGDAALPLVPLEQTAAESMALLRRALARGLLAEAASRWQVMVKGAGAGCGNSMMQDAALRALLEGVGRVLSGDALGGDQHLRPLTSAAHDEPSFLWLASLWCARAAWRSGNLADAALLAQAALQQGAAIDEEARAVSLLCLAEVGTADGQSPARQLSTLAEALATFTRAGSAWDESRALLVQARLEARLGQAERSLQSARRASAADPGWDEPALFLSRAALDRGALNEAESLLRDHRSPGAARDRAVLAAIRERRISLERAKEFLREREAPPGPDALAALQRLAAAFPTFFEAREALGWMLLKTGQYASAQAVLRGLLGEKLSAGDRASVMLGLGCIASAGKQGKPEQRLKAAVGVTGKSEPVVANVPPMVGKSISSPGLRAAFSGHLGTFALPDLLEFLRTGRRTGLLVCSSEVGMGALRFSSGSITGAAAPGVATLGELLLRAGHVDAVGLAVVRARQTTNDKQTPGAADNLLGELLVREGKATVQSVRWAAAEQIRLSVRVLIDWHDGEFVFDREESESEAGATAVSLDPQALLLDLFREQDERARDGAADA
jgi:tetratricopeptide (TPR) repeat protein